LFRFILASDQNKLYGLNGSGWAPVGLSDKFLLDQGINSIGLESVHAVTIPGAIDAWSRLLTDHGTRSFADILAPAIELAEGGFHVHERTAVDWGEEVLKLSKDEGARSQLLINGRARGQASECDFLNLHQHFGFWPAKGGTPFTMDQ